MPAGGGQAYLGVGAASAASGFDLKALAEVVLAAGGCGWSQVAAVATTERLAGDPRVTGLGPPVVGFAAGVLGGVAGTGRSDRVRAATGTGSVAEAAALLAAGPGARLLVPKRRGALVTAALAWR